MPLDRILPRPSGTMPAQPACAARMAQPGPARPRPAQHARPTAWPSSAGASVRAVALHACAAAATSPVHGRRPRKARWVLTGAWTAASGGTAVRRRPMRTAVERVSAAGRRENAAARRTHRRVGRGRRRRRRAQTCAVGSGQRRSAVGVARQSAAALSERGT
jgi:hypothetical protein